MANTDPSISASDITTRKATKKKKNSGILDVEMGPRSILTWKTIGGDKIFEVKLKVAPKNLAEINSTLQKLLKKLKKVQKEDEESIKNGND